MLAGTKLQRLGRALKKAFSNFGNIRVPEGFFNEMIRLQYD